MRNRTFEEIARKLIDSFQKEIEKNRIIEKIRNVAAELGYRILINLEVTFAIQEIDPEKEIEPAKNPISFILTLKDIAFLKQLKISAPKNNRLP